MPLSILLPYDATGFTNSTNACHRDDSAAVATHSWASLASGVRELFLTYPIDATMPPNARIRSWWFCHSVRVTGTGGTPSFTLFWDHAGTGSRAGGNQGSWSAITDRSGNREVSTDFCFPSTSLARYTTSVWTGSWTHGRGTSSDTAMPNSSQDGYVLRQLMSDQQARVRAQFNRSGNVAAVTCEVDYVELYVDWAWQPSLWRFDVAETIALTGTGRVVGGGVGRASASKAAAASGRTVGGGVQQSSGVKAGAAAGRAAAAGAAGGPGVKAATSTGTATGGGMLRAAAVVARAAAGRLLGAGASSGPGVKASEGTGRTAAGGAAHGEGAASLSGSGYGVAFGGGTATGDGAKTAAGPGRLSASGSLIGALFEHLTGRHIRVGRAAAGKARQGASAAEPAGRIAPARPRRQTGPLTPRLKFRKGR